MFLDIIVGLIIGVSLVISIKSILIKNKMMGIMELILTIIFPVMYFIWCNMKIRFAFEGTDFEFLVQTIFIDRLIEPWLISILFILLVIITIYNLIFIVKIKK